MLRKIFLQLWENVSGSIKGPERSSEKSHLVWGAVLLFAASRRLFVVFADVHHLSLGALPDQVSAHAGNILKSMTWGNKRTNTLTRV